MGSIQLFGYGSLVNRASAVETLGREVGDLQPAVIGGWRRRWSLLRDNPYCEKTFALDDGSVPDWLLTLNVEPTGDPADRVNGVLIEISEDDIPTLDIREVRYRRVEVTTVTGLPVVTYTATHQHTAIVTPAKALILDSYLNAVEQGFRELGDDQLDEFRLTTGEPPAPVVSGHLIRHEAVGPSPRDW